MTAEMMLPRDGCELMTMRPGSYVVNYDDDYHVGRFFSLRMWRANMFQHRPACLSRIATAIAEYAVRGWRNEKPRPSSRRHKPRRAAVEQVEVARARTKHGGVVSVSLSLSSPLFFGIILSQVNFRTKCEKCLDATLTADATARLRPTVPVNHVTLKICALSLLPSRHCTASKKKKEAVRHCPR